MPTVIRTTITRNTGILQEPATEAERDGIFIKYNNNNNKRWHTPLMNSVLSKTKKSAPPTRTIQGEMKKCQKASRFSSQHQRIGKTGEQVSELINQVVKISNISDFKLC